MSGWMDGWMVGWMDGWIDEWMVGWLGEGCCGSVIRSWLSVDFPSVVDGWFD